MVQRSDAILIAGANGSGKTTFARQFLQVLFPGIEFLNSDEIQRESHGYRHPVSAGRELLRRLERAEASGSSFAVETTLSTGRYVQRVHRWRQLGYRTSLHFIEVPSADFAVRRVEMRVAAGGHSVPERDIRRRFGRGLRLLESAYKPAVERWYHWLSDERGLRLADRKD